MSNETEQEVWNQTHAQLLKNVAEAQGKLLAGINEISEMRGAIEGRIDARWSELVRKVDGHNRELFESWFREGALSVKRAAKPKKKRARK